MCFSVLLQAMLVRLAKGCDYLIWLKSIDVVDGGVRGRRPRKNLINIVDEARRFVVDFRRRNFDGRLQQICARGLSL